MIGRYRSLLATPGALVFVVSGLLARLPAAMRPLGCVADLHGARPASLVWCAGVLVAVLAILTRWRYLRKNREVTVQEVREDAKGAA